MFRYWKRSDSELVNQYCISDWEYGIYFSHVSNIVV